MKTIPPHPQSNLYNILEGICVNDKQDLARRACQGDAAAFAAWIGNEQARLYRLAFAHLRHEQDALEAVQETTYRAYKNIRKLREPAFIRTWVTRILLNICTDELKRRNRSLVAIDNVAEVVDEASSLAVQNVSIHIAIDALDAQSKQMIILKYLEDLTIAHIAELLEIPEGTVKTRLHRALGELRKWMREDVRSNG